MPSLWQWFQETFKIVTVGSVRKPLTGQSTDDDASLFKYSGQSTDFGIPGCHTTCFQQAHFTLADTTTMICKVVVVIRGRGRCSGHSALINCRWGL